MLKIPQITTRHLSIANNIRLTLVAGLVMSCILIAVISLTSWHGLNTHNEKLEGVVYSQLKTDIIYDMRVAARERNIQLLKMMHLDDQFDIDLEWMKFREQGGVFLIAREKFLKLDLTEQERNKLKEQRDLSRKGVKLQYEIYDLIIRNDYASALIILEDHFKYQKHVFILLDELLDIQKIKNDLHVKEARESRENAVQAVSLLSVVVVVIILLMTLYMIRRLSEQATDIENEGLKFKALIEGSMDAVLVLEKHRVIDCNVNALNMLSVGSLGELNQVGLDYFSKFSDVKSSNNSKEIFSAVNHELVDVRRKYEWNFVDSEGREIPTDVELTGVELDGEKFVQMVVRDVSERKRIQRELLEANDNLELKVQKRTEELNELNTKIASIARSAGMAEVASGVLHNVGNVLNSVNVSTSILKDQINKCKSGNLEKLANMLSDNTHDMCNFLEKDDKGKLIIPYIQQLSEQLKADQEKQTDELNSLVDNVEHIKNIITMQQSYAGNMGVIDTLKASLVFEDAVKIDIASINKKNIKLTKEYKDDPEISVDKHKLIQVLVNLISNAKHAVQHNEEENKKINIKIERQDDLIMFSVEDNGVGIAEKDLGRIFEFGFKKRIGGHGYGLHHSALMAKELGGTIFVESEGPGKGARFTLSMPV